MTSHISIMSRSGHLLNSHGLVASMLYKGEATPEEIASLLNRDVDDPCAGSEAYDSGHLQKVMQPPHNVPNKTTASLLQDAGRHIQGAIRASKRKQTVACAAAVKTAKEIRTSSIQTGRKSCAQPQILITKLQEKIEGQLSVLAARGLPFVGKPTVVGSGRPIARVTSGSSSLPGSAGLHPEIWPSYLKGEKMPLSVAMAPIKVGGLCQMQGSSPARGLRYAPLQYKTSSGSLFDFNVLGSRSLGLGAVISQHYERNPVVICTDGVLVSALDGNVPIHGNPVASRNELVYLALGHEKRAHIVGHNGDRDPGCVLKRSTLHLAGRPGFAAIHLACFPAFALRVKHVQEGASWVNGSKCRPHHLSCTMRYSAFL